jgi:hypothetical protein
MLQATPSPRRRPGPEHEGSDRGIAARWLGACSTIVILSGMAVRRLVRAVPVVWRRGARGRLSRTTRITLPSLDSCTAPPTIATSIDARAHARPAGYAAPAKLTDPFASAIRVTVTPTSPPAGGPCRRLLARLTGRGGAAGR